MRTLSNKRTNWQSYLFLSLLILIGCLGVDYFHTVGSAHRISTQQQQATPAISNINPTQITTGKPPKKLVIDGNGFQSGAMVEIDGARFDAKITKQGKRAVLQTRNLPALIFQQAGARAISIVNPDNGRSNPFVISVVDANSARIVFQDPNPVVNEGTQLQLRAQVFDAQGNVINNAPVSFETGSPEIATIDQTGQVRGVLQGFATITARSNNIVGSVNLTVTRVSTSPPIQDQMNGEIRVDLNGNVYITDLVHHVLRRGAIAQQATIFAGNFDLPGNLNGQRLTSRFNSPLGVAIDNGSGFIYIADSANQVIRRLRPNGIVETIAGVSGQSGSQDGPIASATFNNPRGIAIDRGGNIYVADTDNNTIRFIDLGEGVVSTVAGLAGQSGLRDGQGTNVRFAKPQSLVLAESRAGLFSQGQSTILLIADTANRVIRSMSISDLVVTTVGPAPQTPATEITPLQNNPFVFNNPSAIGRDDGGNIYVCDNGDVRLITPEGELFDLAGDNSFTNPTGVAVLGTTGFVLDAGNGSKPATIKTVTVGSPAIKQLSPNSAPVTGGVEIVVDGANFSDDTRVLFDGIDAQMLLVESATRLRLIAPAVNGSGTRTMTIFTRGGIVQSAFTFLPPALAQLNNGEITTFAGGTNFVGDGGNAINATLGFPSGLSVDATGKLLVADLNNQRVRRIDIATGIIISVAGTGTFGGGGDEQDALTANLTTPNDVAIDSDGNIYTTNFTSVIKIAAKDRKITTIAGGGGFGDGGDGGPAELSQLGTQLSIAVDSQDNIYIADAVFNRVRKIDGDTGIITSFAGVPGMDGAFGGDNGPAINSRLNAPFDIAFDLNDNLFIADRGNARVRRVDAQSGIITTVAGNGTVDFKGDGGQATAAAFTDVRAVAIDGLGNLFIADRESHRIRFVDITTGIIDTIAGRGDDGFAGDGGDAESAALSRPTAIVLDGVGNLFIADGDNNRIRMVDDQTGIITTIAGTGSLDFAGDRTLAVQARLFAPQSILFDAQGNLVIADTQAGRVRSIDSTSLLIETIAGIRPSQGLGDDGPAKQAFLGLPTVLATDANGNLLVLDTHFNDLRRINRATGLITRVAGNRAFGFSGDGGNALMASFANPTGLAVDRNGNIFIADTFNNRVRRIDANNNQITTIVGTGVPGFSGDGGAANNAQLSFPAALAFDPQGNLYISDVVNRRIRRVDMATNIISTFVGTNSGDFGGDNGPANQAAISIASAMVFDRNGNLYFSDQFNNRVRRVDARSNVITTIVGNGTDGFVGDGNAAINANLSAPNGLAFDDDGNLYIADQFNDAIRVVKAVAK